MYLLKPLKMPLPKCVAQLAEDGQELVETKVLGTTF